MASEPLPVSLVLRLQPRIGFGFCFFPRRQRWTGAERKRDAP
ncbi:hypothetical protein ACFQL7_16055 [Halocatena marina]|uniref:Uncharacterized protein n=1 Tax=Halocatena marina TaxID=2934937 RepID=A0ABD5YXE1_9EURY